MSTKYIKKTLKELNVDFERDYEVFNTSKEGDSILSFEYYLPEYNAMIDTKESNRELKSLYCVRNQIRFITLPWKESSESIELLNQWIEYWRGDRQEIPLQSEVFTKKKPVKN